MAKNLSFQQAIEASQTLIQRLDDDKISSAEARQEIAELLEELAAARGFFVALLTGEWTFANEIPQVICEAVRQQPEHAYNLIAKNFVMSTATEVAHLRCKHPELAEGSKRVADRSRYLIEKLNNGIIHKELSDMKEAVACRLRGEINQEGDVGACLDFLDRWSYDTDQLEMVAMQLDKLKELLQPSEPCLEE